MTQDNKKRGTLAAAMPLLLIVSVLAVGPAEADHGSGVVTAEGVAAGGAHTCVLTSGGDVDCYGYWDSQAADYTGGDAVGVAAGGDHTCVLRSGGDVDCYGYNGYGQAADWIGDSDGDGVHNDVDNCPSTPNMVDMVDMNFDSDVVPVSVGDTCSKVLTSVPASNPPPSLLGIPDGYDIEGMMRSVPMDTLKT